jgi:hypothetical protein
MSAARSRRNRDATHVVGGARWLVAELIRFDHRSIRRPRPMVEALIEIEHAGCLGGRQAETGIGAWPLDVRPLLLDSTPDARSVEDRHLVDAMTAAGARQAMAADFFRTCPTANVSNVSGAEVEEGSHPALLAASSSRSQAWLSLQPTLDGFGRQLGARVDVELGEDVDQVGLDGGPRDEQPGSDRRIG